MYAPPTAQPMRSASSDTGESAVFDICSPSVSAYTFSATSDSARFHGTPVRSHRWARRSASFDDFSAGPCSRIWLKLTDATLTEIDAGEYQAWNCLNWYYNAVKADVAIYTKLHLNGCFRLTPLTDEYGALAGVLKASTPLPVGDGNRDCVWIDEDRYHYLFGLGMGDCFNGCPIGMWLYFATEIPGDLAEAGIWHPRMKVTLRLIGPMRQRSANRLGGRFASMTNRRLRRR